MKQEFEMSEEELQAIYDISRNQDPVIFVGVWLGMDTQEKANKLWQLMGDKYGFVWDSAEGSAKGKRFFLATPKEKVIPKTQTEIETDKYIGDVNFNYLNSDVRNAISKIVSQLESCNYEAEGGYLKNNIAFLALKKLSN